MEVRFRGFTPKQLLTGVPQKGTVCLHSTQNECRVGVSYISAKENPN